MNLKKAILSVFDRDGLKEIVDDIELEDIDRRSAEEMRSALSRARRVRPEVLLEYLYESQIKEVCEICSVSNKGRRKKLIQRLFREARKNGFGKKKKGVTNQKRRLSEMAESVKEEDTVQKDDSNNHTRPVRLPDPPAGMFHVSKTELVWPGKYNEDGSLKEVPRVNLPFQVIETINESRATREAKKVPQNLSLFDLWEGKEGDSFDEGWKNKIIWGDNLLVMGSLLEKFAGKIDLIYIDPPFATGADFSFSTELGESGEEITKEQSAIEEKAYRDTWGQGTNSYLSMMHKRLSLMRDLLAEKGSIYVHCDWRVDSLMRSLMDEVFGADALRNEIIWHYEKWTSPSGTSFQKNHDVVLFFTKSKANYFNVIRHVTPNLEEKYRKGYLLGGGGGSRGLVVYDPENPKVKELIASGKYDVVYASKEGKPLSDVWQIPFINPVASERINYPTQKPEALLERIVRASSKEGSLIADFFCGSGTTCAVAEKLGQRWIGCDLSRWAIHITRKRLLGIENCKPFEVLNLGKYERKYWVGITFGGKKKDDHQVVIFQYIAFMLRLYNAEPLTGTQHIHGKKGHALVHIGAVDAPVTIDEVNACIEECLAVGQSEIHVLGWEWEMGMTPFIVQEARRRGIKLLLLNIPREVMEQQAVEKGDILFFEVAHLEVEIKKEKDREVKINLSDFAFPYADMIPGDVRDKIKKWSDYIDYWAVDWNFQNDTFMNGWVSYRTRKERKLPLSSDPHTYDEPGTCTIMVKVVDIFGNDTSQTFDVEVN